jgi:signal transduction histidine kinase
VDVKIEVLDIIAVVVLVCLILVGYLFLTPTVVRQNVSATSLVQTPGSSAVYFLNLSASGGYRELSLSIGQIKFQHPPGWSYSVTHASFTLAAGGNYSDAITIHIAPNATVDSNATLTFLLYSARSPGTFSQSFTLKATAASSQYIQASGEVLTVSVQGLSFIPWYGVIGPLSVVVVSVGIGTVVSYLPKSPPQR